LGDEQSGHVAAVGFELYVSLLDDAVEELRAADGAGRPEAAVRLDVDVDAYLPADYIPFEAAKIDVHRRVSGAGDVGDLRALRDELRDRFGPVPEPVENLMELQRARIALGALGARTVEFRGSRLSVTPLEMDAAAVARLREGMPEAMYESRVKTLSVRVADEPEARLAAVLGLAEAVRGAVPEPVAA
jgi:transcription-repair coupling factor (superfamily II helicase)